MTKQLRQKFKYLENKKSFKDKILSFSSFSKAFIEVNKKFFGRWVSNFKGPRIELASAFKNFYCLVNDLIIRPRFIIDNRKLFSIMFFSGFWGCRYVHNDKHFKRIKNIKNKWYLVCKYSDAKIYTTELLIFQWSQKTFIINLWGEKGCIWVQLVSHFFTTVPSGNISLEKRLSIAKSWTEVLLKIRYVINFGCFSEDSY